MWSLWPDQIIEYYVSVERWKPSHSVFLPAIDKMVKGDSYSGNCHHFLLRQNFQLNIVFNKWEEVCSLDRLYGEV